MNKAIIRHELARQAASTLTLKRSALLSECESFDTVEDNHGQIVEIGQTCGMAAWSYMEDANHKSHWDEQLTFEDAFKIYINDENGACDKCLEAYKIRNNELAQAKREFGNAKRSISYYGKKLIKEEAAS